VPILTCGFLRSNFCFAIESPNTLCQAFWLPLGP